MFTIRHYFICIVFIFAITTTLSAQYLNRFRAGNFSSAKGLFSVEIPIDVMSSGIKPLSLQESGEIGEGYSYSWYTKKISFWTDFIDISKNSVTNTLTDEQILNTLFANIEANFRADANNTNITVNEMIQNQNTAKEIRVFKTNINFYFNLRIIVKNKTYFRLFTGFTDKENQAVADKFLNSFKTITYEEAVNNVIERETPPELPQNTAIAKIKSDAEDALLKGKIKEVSEFWESLKDGTRYQISKEFYNVQGNLLKTISFEENYPMAIKVYGFIDNMRVSKTGFVQTETRSFGRMAFVNKNKPDDRFMDRYEYKYDEKRRLKEKSVYRNDGQITNRTTFDYKENNVEEVRYDGEKIVFKGFYTYDKKGLLTEESTTYFSNNTPRERTSKHKYEVFDKQGNWTKRINSSQETKDGITTFVPTSINYRTITYHN